MHRIYAILLILPLILGAGQSLPPPAVSEVPFRADASIVPGVKGFAIQLYAGPKFYRDSTGKWKEPDLSVASVGNVRTVNAGPYRAKWDSRTPDYTFAVGQDSVSYMAAFDLKGITVKTESKRWGVKQTYTLSGSTAAHTLKWQAKTSLEVDHGIFRDRNGKEVFRLETPWAEDANKRPVPVEVSWKLDTLIYEVKPEAGAVYPITVDPTTVTTQVTSTAYLYKDGGTSWATTRDATTATVLTDYFYWGVSYWAGPPVNYNILRQFLCFNLAGITAGYVCDSCKLWFYRSGTDYLDNTLWTQICRSTQTGAPATGWINDFDGWNSGSPHTPIILSDSIAVTDAGMPTNQWFSLAFNAAGCDTLENRFGGSDSLRVVILTREDINNVAPVAYNKFLCVVDSVAKLIVYASAGGWTGTVNGITDPAEVMGVPVANIQEINRVP